MLNYFQHCFLSFFLIYRWKRDLDFSLLMQMKHLMLLLYRVYDDCDPSLLKFKETVSNFHFASTQKWPSSLLSSLFAVLFLVAHHIILFFACLTTFLRKTTNSFILCPPSFFFSPLNILVLSFPSTCLRRSPSKHGGIGHRIPWTIFSCVWSMDHLWIY